MPSLTATSSPREGAGRASTSKRTGAGPWQPGDVVNGHAFTGVGWVPLPWGWRNDPTGRHQFRWWTGTTWSSRVQTNGIQFDDPWMPATAATSVTPSLHPQATRGRVSVPEPIGFFDVIDTIGWVLYGGFWLTVAIFSAAIAARENEPRYLLLTSTASLNILLFKLTGRTRSELNRRAGRAVKRNISYLVGGAIAAGSVWLGLHFDDQNLMIVFLFIAFVALVCAWAFS